MNPEARIAITRLSMSECLFGSESAAVARECLQQYATFDPEKAAAEVAKVQAKACERVFGGAPSAAAEKPFTYQDGIAVVPVYGVLLNKFNSCWGFVTGYQFIRSQAALADADPDVKLIVFDHDTPGGDASGCFETTAIIRDLATPTLAMVDDLAASGGYATAAACDRVVATPSASVGSIGVYRMMIDLREMDAQIGIKFDFIVSTGSDFKLAGNPHVELTEEMRDWFQQSVDQRMQEFVEDIVASRGLNEDEIRGTQARVYRAQDGLALGLVDAVNDPTDAVAAFLAELGTDEPIEEDEDMALPKTEAEFARAIEDAKAEAIASVEKPDLAKVASDAVAADRTRREAITSCDEAKDKPKLAASLANKDGMTVELAKSILVDAAVEAPTAPKGGDKSHFENAMDKSGGANVSAEENADNVSGGDKPTDEQVGAGLVAFLAPNRRVKSAA